MSKQVKKTGENATSASLRPFDTEVYAQMHETYTQQLAEAKARVAGLLAKLAAEHAALSASVEVGDYSGLQNNQLTNLAPERLLGNLVSIGSRSNWLQGEASRSESTQTC